MGYLWAITSGALMSIQGVMNTRLGEKTGMFFSNAFVQGTAFLISLIAMAFAKDNNIKAVADVNRIYLLGGVLGFGITVTVMLSVKSQGPGTAVSAILISQLLFASLIELFGLMETPKIGYGWNKFIGLALMIAGILLFRRNPQA